MKPVVGWSGALAYTAIIAVAIMAPLLIPPLVLSMALPSVALTDNWTILRVISALLIWFVAGMTVTPIVRNLGLGSSFFRRPEVIVWSRRVLEFALLAAFYALFVTPAWAALISTVIATVFCTLTEPHLEKLLTAQKEKLDGADPRMQGEEL